MKKCEKCGKEYIEDYSFCPDCGNYSGIDNNCGSTHKHYDT